MPNIPMKARIGFRDLWENPNAPARKALKALYELLGYQIDVEIDAPKLWSDLSTYYPDPETFAPNITGIVQAWADCLAARLQDDNNAEWTEKLLELLTEKGSTVRARMEPSQSSTVKTNWSTGSSEFSILIPESKPPYSSDPHFSIGQDLDHLFAPRSTSSNAAVKSDHSEWTTIAIPSRDKGPISATPTTLPSVHKLARPEMLFSSQVPYHLIVQVMHNSISVQGSHQPSLQLIKEYFEKYARVDYNNMNKTPILRVEMQPSLFGYGNLLDSLTIAPTNDRANWSPVNPILILSFVESVLEYRSVPEMSRGGQWQFRRDAPFKE